MRSASVSPLLLAASFVTGLGEQRQASAQPSETALTVSGRETPLESLAMLPADAAPGLDGPNVVVDLNAWIDTIGRSEPVHRLVSFFTRDAPVWLPYLGALIAGLIVLGAIWMLWQPNRIRDASPPREEALGAEDGPDSLSAVSAAASRVRLPALTGGGHVRLVGEDDAPSWFDELGFLEISQTHFLRLQAAWDHADYRAMHQCSTPRFSSHLQRERRRLQGTRYTEVLSLHAELVGIQRQDDLVVADLLFKGAVREGEQGPTEQFEDLWRFQHPWDNPRGLWCVAGVHAFSA